ncbi:putative membrane-anchored protein [Amnibacterium kyonggiense]|uniref:Putative membrane-anchored protein n=1 Tax=Amnibacterium kyonggiense TaxID=595671 RepID=A0A4R7FPT4_9MICO|nr:putative membrane-anchored protein [Amnibacterium kyonggiense]
MRTSRDRVRSGNRVAEPGAGFWALKILTTGMGETTSDFLVKSFAPEVVVPAAFLLLLLVLIIQLRAHTYHPARYWTTALMVSVFGTMAADVLHVGIGVPYAVSTALFAAALAVVFITWWRTEGTLSVHEITTGRRERFYWAAVMATFALGTAAGDFSAASLGLGYLGSGFLFLVAFAVPGLIFLVTRRAAIATFWAAYVMTRPLGASFADWFAVPGARGGLDLGAGPVSGVLLMVFIGTVAVLAIRSRSPLLLSGGAQTD